MTLFWNRVFARLTDYGLFYFIGVFLSLILPFEFQDNFYFSFALAVPLLWAPLEALFLRRFNVTPGKKAFGIRIENLTSWGQALKRAFFIPTRPGTVFTSPIGKWRHLLALILALTCASSFFLGKSISDAAVQFEGQMVRDGWVQYASDEGNFIVHFPKKPELATHTFDVPNSDKTVDFNEVKAKKSDCTFSVSYLELPKKWRIFSAGTLLKGAIGVVTDHMPGAKLIEKKQGKHKNYPSLDFRMQQGEDLIEGRLILVGSTLYKLTVIYPPDATQENQHVPFLDSFDLKEAP
jgi:hypothetical protein